MGLNQESWAHVEVLYEWQSPTGGIPELLRWRIALWFDHQGKPDVMGPSVEYYDDEDEEWVQDGDCHSHISKEFARLALALAACHRASELVPTMPVIVPVPELAGPA